MYGFLADLTVVVHVAYVAYVVVGQALIMVGWGVGWRWVRNFWFRTTHLLAIVLATFLLCMPRRHSPSTRFEQFTHETSKYSRSSLASSCPVG